MVTYQVEWRGSYGEWGVIDEHHRTRKEAEDAAVRLGCKPGEWRVGRVEVRVA